MRRIASRQNPVVARFRAAARGDADGVMLLDGIHLVEEAVAAGVTIREVAIAAADGDARSDIVAQLERAGVDVMSATAPVMAALSPVRSPSSIVALAVRPDRADVFHREPPCLILIVGVQDPGNVGAIVRVAEAAGATGAIVAGNSADPFGWKALRGSMGSSLRLPVRSVNGSVGAVTVEARRHGCRILATVPRGGRSVFDVDLRGPLMVAVGGEGPGLDAAFVAAADERVTIPMQAPVESLNAAVTAALVLYEARRQRSQTTTTRGNALS
jgi:RNA methyltransferase, TrmH family